MVDITTTIAIDDRELKITYIRSPGPGGQNVNKVATGVQLRFNVTHSPSIPADVRERLLAMLGNKLTAHGDLVIKAIRYRTQGRNRLDAIERLQTLIQKAVPAPKKRKKTKPTYTATQKRLDKKKTRGTTKSLRRKNPRHDD